MERLLSGWRALARKGLAMLLLGPILLSVSISPVGSTPLWTELTPLYLELGNDFLNVQLVATNYDGPFVPGTHINFTAYSEIWSSPNGVNPVSYRWIVCGSIGTGYLRCMSTNLSAFDTFGFTFVESRTAVGPIVYSVTALIQDEIGREAVSTAIVYLNPDGKFSMIASAVYASMNAWDVSAVKPVFSSQSESVRLSAAGYAWTSSDPLDLSTEGALINPDGMQASPLADFATEDTQTPTQCTLAGLAVGSVTTLNFTAPQTETCILTFVYSPGYTNQGACTTQLYLGVPVAVGSANVTNTTYPFCSIGYYLYPGAFLNNGLWGQLYANSDPVFAQGYLVFHVTDASLSGELEAFLTDPYVLAGVGAVAAVSIAVVILHGGKKPPPVPAHPPGGARP